MKFQFLALSLLVLILPRTSHAQQSAIDDLGRLVRQTATCDLSQTSLRKVYLGMTVAEARQVFPRWKPGRASVIDELQTSFNAPKSNNSALWKGVREYALTFFEGRAYSIIVIYNRSTVWESPDQFASAVAESLKLPDRWETLSQSHRVMTCGDYWIAAGIDGSYPFVAMTDRVAQERRTQRVKEAGYALQELIEADRESQRRAFKP